MNPEYPYRPDNHYVFPRKPLEVMDEHMKLYPEGEEFRWSIIGLRNQYKETPFMNLMEEYSRIITVARVEASGGERAIDASDYDKYFLGGSIMAIHTMLYPAPSSSKRYVLNQNPLSELRSTPECKEKADFLEQVIEQMRIWDSEGAKVSYDHQTEEFKEKLLELSIYAFNDLEKPEGKDTDFISGFMFASELIWRYARFSGPPV